MRCRHCGCLNAEGEHRCEMCGRRLQVDDPPRPAVKYPLRRTSPLPSTRPDLKPAPEARPPAPRNGAGIPRQASLFPAAEGPKVVPIAPPARLPGRATAGQGAGRKRTTPPQPTRLSQQTLNLESPQPPPPRICCDAPIAPTSLRCAVVVADGFFVLLGLSLFLLTFHLVGGRIVLTQQAGIAYLVVATALALFYHSFWCVLGRETAGMRCFRLRLLNFDGYRPEPRQRVMRLLTGCLGILAAGLGLLWALFDAEKLTWHDHVSQTFPTFDGPRRG